MTSATDVSPPHTSKPYPPRRTLNSRRLQLWLALVSLGAGVLACGSIIFGLLINMDTQIEMNPRGDALVRQDALGFRAFAWGGIALLILVLASGIIGSWLAYRRGYARRAFGFSLLAAVPSLLSVAGFAVLALVGGQ
jgi:hypothetical protein